MSRRPWFPPGDLAVNWSLIFGRDPPKSCLAAGTPTSDLHRLLQCVTLGLLFYVKPETVQSIGTDRQRNARQWHLDLPNGNDGRLAICPTTMTNILLRLSYPYERPSHNDSCPSIRATEPSVCLLRQIEQRACSRRQNGLPEPVQRAVQTRLGKARG
jgi:hypothetical protein